MVSDHRRVLVTHPGRQHSHQNALALERAGELALLFRSCCPQPERERLRERVLATVAALY